MSAASKQKAKDTRARNKSKAAAEKKKKEEEEEEEEDAKKAKKDKADAERAATGARRKPRIGIWSFCNVKKVVEALY
jgi:hypothetical protein